MATDLFDANLQKAREARWEKVFGVIDQDQKGISFEDMEATAVMETVMQVSNVVHTMQDWESISPME